MLFDEKYLRAVEEALDPYLIDVVITENGEMKQIPPNYNPVVWEITLTGERIIKKEIIN